MERDLALFAQIESSHFLDVADEQDAVHRRVVPRFAGDGGKPRDLLMGLRIRASRGRRRREYVFAMSEEGDTYVVEAANEYKLVRTNSLDE